MPAYKLKEAVEEIAKEREISLYGSHYDLIREIAGELESGSLTAKEAVEKLKDDNKDFRLNFKREDYDEIEKAIR